MSHTSENRDIRFPYTKNESPNGYFVTGILQFSHIIPEIEETVGFRQSNIGKQAVGQFIVISKPGRNPVVENPKF